MNSPAGALRLISGVGAKGPACFVLEAAGRRLMLDLGEGPPPGYLPAIDGVGRIDALVLSHGHKDHVGGIALLAKLGNPPVYATAPVARALSKSIAQSITVRELPIGGIGEVLGIAVSTGRNGHAPGGVWLHFAVGDGVLYTGDWSAESLLYAYDRPRTVAAVALVDSSYGTYEEPLAACLSALEPLLARGPLLLPAPANGRGPEMALAIARHGIGDLFLDEAMRAALERLGDGEAVSVSEGVDTDIAQLAARARPIAGARGVMLAASADGTSGATARLLVDWEDASEPAIVFTGYVPQGTPAERLIKCGRARFVRWNVHPRLSDLVALVRDIKAKTVIPAFCDRTQLAGLAAALAPARVVMDGPVAV